jgi:hypothetical protein
VVPEELPPVAVPAVLAALGVCVGEAEAVGGAVVGGAVVGGAVVGGAVVGGAVVGACVVGAADVGVDGAVGCSVAPPEAVGQLEGGTTALAAEGTDVGAMLDGVTDGLAVARSVPSAAGGVRHGAGLDALPGRAAGGRVPPRVPAEPLADAPRAPVADAAPPPVPPTPGCSPPLPPVSTVALTWASAARSGGSDIVTAVTQAAAARPAPSRTHNRPCDRRERESWAGQPVAREAAPAQAAASKADERVPRARPRQSATGPWSTWYRACQKPGSCQAQCPCHTQCRVRRSPSAATLASHDRGAVPLVRTRMRSSPPSPGSTWLTAADSACRSASSRPSSGAIMPPARHTAVS